MPGLAERLQARNESHDAVDRAAQVDAENPVPVLVRRHVHRAKDVDAGVVDEDVDLPEDLFGLVGRAHESVAVGDIELERMHTSGCILEVRECLIAMRFAHVGDDDLGAGRREGARDAEADATHAAGDEDDFVLEILHDDSLGRSADVAVNPTPALQSLRRDSDAARSAP